jgi:hypothetical protein
VTAVARARRRRDRGRGRGRGRDDRGQSAAVEMMFGFLWIVAVAMVVVTIPTWIEEQAAARAAADEAARAVVTADSCSEGQARGAELVRDVEEAHGLDAGDLQLSWGPCSLSRGSRVTAHVHFQVAAVSLPLGIEAGSFGRTVSHTESVDLYRSD